MEKDFSQVFSEVSSQVSSQDFYKRVIHAVDTPMYVTDAEGVFVCVNPAFERLSGYPAAEAVGQPTSLLKSGEMPEAYYQRLWKTIEAGESWKEEIVNRGRDGSIYRVLQSISPIRDESGAIRYYTAVQYDITREKELQDERNIFFDVSIDLFCIADRGGLLRQLNAAWAKDLSRDVPSLTGTPLEEAVCSDDRGTLGETLRRAVDAGEAVDTDVRMLTGNGGCRWVSWRIYYYPEKELFYASGRDIQKRVEMEQEIRRISVTDKLTGIYNRLQCDERIAQETARAERTGHSLALILFDIDHFKAVNDTYGHQQGDQVLMDLAGLVQEEMREYDFLARWGGEEFLVLSPETGRGDASALAERIRRRVETRTFGEAGRVTISLGVSLYRPGADTAESFLQRADRALYRAKEQGRNRTVLEEGGR